MKRIANAAAVETICYVISGNQHIKIVDYDNDYTMSNDKNGTQGTVVFDAPLKTKYDGSYRYEKYFRAQCHGIIVDGDTLIFQVLTKFEQY